MPTPTEDPQDRAAALLATLSLEEKLAQLGSAWLMRGADGEPAPYSSALVPAAPDVAPANAQLAHGIGQLTRVFGSTPLTIAQGVTFLRELQRRLVDDTPAGIPAIVHEECLAGVMALGATVFPCPLNWGSTWDPELVGEVGTAIGEQMRAIGAHQGLAPVLDVVRDARWGRVEECIAEDPYLVGMIGSAYIAGLQQDPPSGASVAATGKHFAGYSFSEGGRNLAPAHVGPRDMADVFLVPFEMAVKLAGLRSIMNAYQDIDGVPAAASAELLTHVLRERWGFDGVVVSDYFSVAWLEQLHATAASKSEAAAMALRAGVDCELPATDAYGAPLAVALEAGLVTTDDVDRAALRVLRFKARLGVLDHPAPPSGATPDLDDAAHRAVARRVAERSIVLLHNDGVLPLSRHVTIAVIGPNAARGDALLGNYSFAHHVAAHFGDAPDVPPVTSFVDALRAAAPDTSIAYQRGCDVVDPDTAGIAGAVAAAAHADVAVLVVGDQAGHFGQGTSGEGTDTDDLRLPGVQEGLIEAVCATGTPVVVVLVSGRPYDLSRLTTAAAIVEAWFPGEEGGNAVASVLFGDVNPSGKIPVTFSRGAGQQPAFYNAKRLAFVGYARSSTRPVFPFGHGLSYTTFEYSDLAVTASAPLDGAVVIEATVRNSGTRTGAEIVQLYVTDVAASVTRPVIELKGFARLELSAGASARVRFDLPADMVSFTGVDYERIVEPGRFDVLIGASSRDIRLRGSFELVGAAARRLGEDRALVTPATVTPI